MGMEKLYSINETARALGGISRHTVKAWLSQGKLQRTKVGNRTMIAESELLRIIDKGGVSVSQSARKRETAPEGSESAVA